MQQNGDMCEYIDVYVDDLEIVESYPKVLMHDIWKRYKLNLKGMIPM